MTTYTLPQAVAELARRYTRTTPRELLATLQRQGAIHRDRYGHWQANPDHGDRVRLQPRQTSITSHQGQTIPRHYHGIVITAAGLDWLDEILTRAHAA